ncbi:hypothetical protein AYK24_09820 [Thermoplasmatales archaeon SG8-52-4]|nr:MAG: hypothetical protein AYK24_09820 [Thermoplasmatales archaeon SG8-52-4]
MWGLIIKMKTQKLEIKICEHKVTVEQILLPTKSKCEDCDGYNIKCPDYRALDKDYFEKFGDL